MNDASSELPNHKASPLKTAVFLVALAVGIFLAYAAFQAVNNSGSETMNGLQAGDATTQTESIDPVKETTGDNGDTTPSPTGTGPGSENSLLGQ